MGVVDEGSGQAEVNVKKKTADFWSEESCHLWLYDKNLCKKKIIKLQ